MDNLKNVDDNERKKKDKIDKKELKKATLLFNQFKEQSSD